MRRQATLSVLFLATMLSTARAEEPASFAGRWRTSYGVMTLTQEGAKVSGQYVLNGVRSQINGTVAGRKLTFTYREPTVRGEGWFELAADGKHFAGKWREQGAQDWYGWLGQRLGEAAPGPAAGFAGLWETSFGRMRVVKTDDGLRGRYTHASGSTVEGEVSERRFEFEYQEPDVRGEGVFTLSEDGQSFTGKWREAGQTTWSPWNGRRVVPVEGRKWLVVVEARWERSIAEREYAFGQMLRSFFARVPHVQVRHRFFTSEAGLRRWLGEVAFLAEPVALVLASHGTDAGLTVDGKTIGPEAIAEALGDAGNVQLMHFSACQIMKGGAAKKLQDALPVGARFPVSGYTTSVDWAASALIEFLYLDLVLSRGMSPARAAEQLEKLVPFSGDRRVAGSPIAPAGFRIRVPSDRPAPARAAEAANSESGGR